MVRTFVSAASSATCSQRIDLTLIGRIKAAIVARARDEALSWDAPSIGAALHDEIAKLGVKPKAFMTVARCQLTGMKVRMPAAWKYAG